MKKVEEKEETKTVKKAPKKLSQKEDKKEEVKVAEEKEPAKKEEKVEKETKPKSKEEILRYTVIGLAIALVLSVIINIVQAVKTGGNNTFVKYNGEKVKLDDALEELIAVGGDTYIDKLANIIMYNSLSEDQINAVKEDVDSTMSYYTQIYGDQFDELVASQTNFANGEEYAKYYLTTTGAIQKIAEEKCVGNESQYCTSIETYQFIYDTLSSAKVEFKNAKLQDKWDTSVKGYITYIDELKAEEAGYPNLKNSTVGEIKELIKNKETFVLLVSQTTCSHCKAFKPVINNIAGEYGLTIYVVESNELNQSDYNDLQKIITYGGTPTTGLFVKGKLVDKVEGEAQSDTVVTKLKNAGIIK